MNEEYWEDFYKSFDVKSPSSFAKFCLDYIDKSKTLIDVGCGNGRDSYFFAKHGINTIGVDQANQPKEAHKVRFMREDYAKIPFINNQVYARFFLHAIENLEIAQFLLKCNGLVMLEFRSVGDIPIIYQDHRRNMVDGRSVFETLADQDFTILWYQLSHGLAKYKDEDPLICRIIAKKRF